MASTLLATQQLTLLHERSNTALEFREIDLRCVSPQTFRSGGTFVYGAGMNGRIFFEALVAAGVDVLGFVDDDPTRRGQDFCGVPIVSADDLLKLDRTTTNIVISSMYIKTIAARLVKMGFKRVFASLTHLMDKDTEEFDFPSAAQDGAYRRGLFELGKFFTDEASTKYLDCLGRSLAAGRALPIITEVCSEEPQYFDAKIRPLLNGVSVLDAGAYTGDTVREMLSLGIRPACVYCFEADPSNYVKLRSYAESEARTKIITENRALWDKSTTLGMKFANYNCRVDRDAVNATVKTAVIDEYFANVKISFIKMDIEGAEQNALKGAARTIKRDRPVLAISMYHGFDDIVGVPKLLIKECENYCFFIRHYSYTYSETILYGVPKEKGVNF